MADIRVGVFPPLQGAALDTEAQAEFVRAAADGAAEVRRLLANA